MEKITVTLGEGLLIETGRQVPDMMICENRTPDWFTHGLLTCFLSHSIYLLFSVMLQE